MRLLSLKESLNLSTKQFGEYYSQYINPGLFSIYKLLGTADMDVTSAQGMEIHLKNGKTILDFTSALGVLGFGHNHPRIIGAEKICHELKILDAVKVAPHKLQAALAYNLAQLLPDPLNVSFFAVSGAEAVEGAMKLCEKVQGNDKKYFITTEGSYHGKTHGALSLTRSGNFGQNFIMGISEDNIKTIPYNDIHALKSVIRKYSTGTTTGTKNPFIAMILEPIQGQSISVTDKGYLNNVVQLCRKKDILVIFDEVRVGMGRTGKFCAFMHEDVVPDIVTLSKALGGGKRAISAFVTSKKLFNKAYGKRKDAGLHSTTFGGLGESCAVAIESLNVLIEENLILEAGDKGRYLYDKLETLRQKFPNAITEIRGQGLFCGIKFNYDNQIIRKLIYPRMGSMINTVDSVFIASIVKELYQSHNILTYFSDPYLDTLHINPPLVVNYEQIDTFIKAVENTIEMGFTKIIGKFIKSNVI